MQFVIDFKPWLVEAANIDEAMKIARQKIQDDMRPEFWTVMDTAGYDADTLSDFTRVN